MEITTKENPFSSPLNSPTTTSTNAGIPITRSDPNSPYPTTFVTADTSSFKQVVQMLTGSSDPTTTPSPTKNFSIPPVRTLPKKQGFKLYERRNNPSLKHMISPLDPNFNSNLSDIKQMDRILSPSLLDFPSLTLSPVTPLLEDPFDKSSPSVGSLSSSSTPSVEEKAIAEKGFYLHPSPMSTPRDLEPQLLPLFPLSSPRETN